MIGLLLTLIGMAIAAAAVIYEFSSAKNKTIVGDNSPKALADSTATLNDVSVIRGALELYYNNSGAYPSELKPGQPLIKDGVVYLGAVPLLNIVNQASPCFGKNYQYELKNGGNSYVLTFCLESPSQGLTVGENMAGPSGFLAPAAVK